MKHLSKVVWHEGMYLGPHHFQVQSQTGESLWLFPRALLYALVMLGTMTAFGLYGSELHKKDREYQVRFLASFPAVAVVLAFVYYAVPESTLARGIMALGLLFSFIFTASARALFFRIVGHDALKRRILVIGSGSRAAEVEALLTRLGPSAGFNLGPLIAACEFFHRDRIPPFSG